jgi:hypothetical protein
MDSLHCGCNRSKDIDLFQHMTQQGMLTGILPEAYLGPPFTEFTLEELGLPNASTLLGITLELVDKIGISGWRINGRESESYKGFSMTYNPQFISARSIYHQTMGAPQLSQTYSRETNIGSHTCVANTYYDSYAFRVVPTLVRLAYTDLLDRLSLPLVRSRVAYRYSDKEVPTNPTNHIDEPSYQVLRINIPLQTTPEQIIRIQRADNTYLDYHLEVGKAYIWDTRIPHRNDVSFPTTPGTPPRIHMILGLSPWFSYDPEIDHFVKGPHWGVPIQEIVTNKLFLKTS